MSGNIPARDLKILSLRCGNRCAMPDCRRMLVADKTPQDREAIVGEMAHIKGEKPESARYDSNITDKERNGYDSLIYLCNKHHRQIDEQPNAFTVAKLHQIKNEAMLK